MGIRLVVVDDNPHLAWDGRVYPVNATFGQFLRAFLEVSGPGGSPAVARITHCVPVRAGTSAPGTLPLDPRIRAVATAPFDGIAGYLRSAPALVRRNAAILRPAIRAADLVWIKVPASNAPLAAALARAAGVRRFGYVAGSARAVAGSQDRGLVGGAAARLVGAGCDLAGRIAILGGDGLVVGADLDGEGIVTSLVEPDEIRSVSPSAPSSARWPGHPGRLQLAWAGRLARGKGLEALLDAVARLVAAPPDGRRVELVVLGDGPARDWLERRAEGLGIAGRITWRGFVADRASYLSALAEADLFVFPSPAEGFPKVILDAFAVGLPVMAAPSGALGGLGGERFAPLPGDPVAIARSLAGLVVDPERAHRLRDAGSRFVAAHTRPAEAARLVARWQARWPELPWG
jgi:glycosyltransferase involved in cell wall biosynthesis